MTASPENHDTVEERWSIVLVPTGESSVPVGRRVAQLLKRAKRDWKLRCVEVSARTPAEQLDRLQAVVLALERENARLRRRLDRAERRRMVPAMV